MGTSVNFTTAEVFCPLLYPFWRRRSIAPALCGRDSDRPSRERWPSPTWEKCRPGSGWNPSDL